MLSTFEIKENINSNHLLAQYLAQAERSRPGEEDPRSGELPSPRRELDLQNQNSVFSLKRDPPRLSETFARPKVQWVAWETLRGEIHRRVPVNLAQARQARLGEFNRLRHCSSLLSTQFMPKQQHKSCHTITTTYKYEKHIIPSKLPSFHQTKGFQLPLPRDKLAKQPYTPSTPKVRAQQLKEGEQQLEGNQRKYSRRGHQKSPTEMPQKSQQKLQRARKQLTWSGKVEVRSERVTANPSRALKQEGQCLGTNLQK